MSQITNNSNFINDCLNNNASPSDIDKYIEYWHNHNTQNSLKEFLGFSDEEMGEYIKPETDTYVFIQTIIQNKRTKY